MKNSRTMSAQQDMGYKKMLEGAPRKHLNWPLIVGLILVASITYLAIAGPSLATKDPKEEHSILMIEGKWQIPPFDVGTPGYPLGSDEFGRDLLSRLLVGIRPTMIMVIVVAVVRLIIGVIIGLSAGWFSGITARFLNSLIQIALALPVLLVALGAIAIVGVELGIWAFIIGLSLTGWVDTALQVREQTRIVKNQAYVEAATAMGAANHQILSNHILKQITPMLLMLFAFEVSSTLMLTAGLGFLGYYIGGDVWVDVDDFVARRISGEPELGQMLATSWVTLTRPWAMVAVGTTIFFTVLGFNLIGEGLRQVMGFAKVQRRNVITEARHRIGLWLDHYFWHPLVQFFRIRPLKLGLAGIAVFFLLSFGAILLLDAATQADVSQVLAKIDQLAGVTPTTSLPANTSKPNETVTPPQIASSPTEQGVVWTYQATSGINYLSPFSGDGSVFLTTSDNKLHIISADGKIRKMIQMEPGPYHKESETGRSAPVNIEPIVMPDETILVVSQDSSVYALDPEGNLLWEQPLEAEPASNPLQDDNGNLYLLDEDARLYMFQNDGLQWHFQSEAAPMVANGHVIGPEGNNYYTVTDYGKAYIQAVSPSGDGLWVTRATTSDIYDELLISKDGRFIALAEDLFDTSNGDLIEVDPGERIDEIIFSPDGRNYARALHTFWEWQAGPSGLEFINKAVVSEGDTTIQQPLFTRVDSNGIFWVYYPSGATGSVIIIVWMTPEGELLGRYQYDRYSYFSGILNFNFENSSITECNYFEETSTLECTVYSPIFDGPKTILKLENKEPFIGGTVIDDYLYIVNADKVTKVYIGTDSTSSE